jgi:hypothetical protein
MIAPFDLHDDNELRMRSPIDFATSFRCPIVMYFGNREHPMFDKYTSRLATLATQAGLTARAVVVPGDHMTSVAPAIADAIEFFRRH